MHERNWKCLLVLSLALSFITPFGLALFLPLGQAIDEIAHTHRIFAQVEGSESTRRLEEGLYTPGVAPYGQGHQAPLYYSLNALLIGLFVDTSEIAPFIDYQAGIQYSSEGGLFGGSGHCSYRMDTSRASEPSTAKTRFLFYGLRIQSAFLLLVTTALGAYCGYLLNPRSLSLAALFAACSASIPTALSRASSVNNDNLVCVLGAAVFTLCLIWLASDAKRVGLWALSLGILAGCSYLSKYNGILMLGLIACASLIHTRLSWSWRIGVGFLMLLSFAALTASDAYENIHYDGDLLSSSFVAHEFSLLSEETPLKSKMSDLNFFKEIVDSFWINFFSKESRYSNYLNQLHLVWWALLGAAFVGLVIGAGKFLRDSLLSRALVLSIAAVVGACSMQIAFSTRFIVVDGRYLHLILIPVSLLLVLGIRSTISVLVPNHFDKVLFFTFGSLLLLGHSVTWGYLGGKYIPCASSTTHNVNGGAELLAIDLNGDAVDELLLFHRIRNRAFVFKKGNDEFQLVPEWTRKCGAAADLPVPLLYDDDELEDLVFYRPSTGSLTFIAGKQFVSHDRTVSPYRDRAAKEIPIANPSVELQRKIKEELKQQRRVDEMFKAGRIKIRAVDNHNRNHYSLLTSNGMNGKELLAYNRIQATISVLKCGNDAGILVCDTTNTQNLWGESR